MILKRLGSYGAVQDKEIKDTRTTTVAEARSKKQQCGTRAHPIYFLLSFTLLFSSTISFTSTIYLIFHPTLLSKIPSPQGKSYKRRKRTCEVIQSDQSQKKIIQSTDRYKAYLHINRTKLNRLCPQYQANLKGLWSLPGKVKARHQCTDNHQ